MSNEYDFVAIGDITTDAFIRLKEASVHCAVNKEKCEICMRFGDKIPYEEVYVVPAVGNSPNAAVSAARLGLKSALVSNVGSDAGGEQCIQALKDEGVGIAYVAINKNAKTNYHYVLWFDDDRTILIKHEKYDYALPDFGASARPLARPRWIYLSSLGEGAIGFYGLIENYLTKHPEIKLAFQPGTFQIKLGADQLKGIYQKTEVFFCNKEEAEKISGMPAGSDSTILLQKLHALGPVVVVITDGVRGAYAFYKNTAWHMPAYPDSKPPYERTGAGDAFASTLVSALALGKPLEEALRWAPINAMSVVQQIGARAGLLSQEKIIGYLNSAPPEYCLRKI